ncbi:MAG TPA: hypothetical protein VKY31_05605 [Terriglobia bacterium]|nr:hypothetical protein [Terriglobia bacterium]
MSTVSNISSAQIFLQPKQDLASLAGALGSGDVKGAQNALTAFEADLQNVQKATSASALPVNLSTDLQQLQGALSSNDLASAQSLFNNFLQDLQHAKGSQAHHHHHHHQAYAENSPQVPNSINIMA